MASVESRKCPECGGSLAEGVRRCAYCGVWLDVGAEPAAAVAEGPTHAVARVGHAWDFGLGGRLPLLVGAVVAALLYAAGWLLEDTRYWLAEEAAAVWGVALPAWLFLVALSWRARWGGWLTGFAVAIPVLALHLGIMWLIEGRLNDDDVGISAMFAGAALAGWLLGRLVHYVVRRARARAVGGGG